MNLEHSVEIDAPSERVWEVLIDVERWPEWTQSMTRVERLGGGPFGLGSKARIKQPRFPEMTWTVCRFEEGRCFEWEARSGGVSTVAGHAVEAQEGASRVTLRIRQRGLLVPLLSALTGRLTRRYVEMEAEGLKRGAEACC